MSGWSSIGERGQANVKSGLWRSIGFKLLEFQPQRACRGSHATRAKRKVCRPMCAFIRRYNFYSLEPSGLTRFPTTRPSSYDSTLHLRVMQSESLALEHPRRPSDRIHGLPATDNESSAGQ